MDVNGQNGKPMLNGTSNGAAHHYNENNGYATNIQTSLGSNPGGKEELINNFQKKIGQDMDLGMKSTAKLLSCSSNQSTNFKFCILNNLDESCLFSICCCCSIKID